jgi:RNA polymerase sigma-70 factor (ECF subfamily)
MESRGIAAAGDSQGTDEEAALLARLRDGDPAAFEILVRSHGHRLLAVTRRFLRNEEDARDAVQEAFLSAFRSIRGFEGNSRLSTWLHRIAVNASLMRLRTKGRDAEEAIDEMLPQFDAEGHHARPVPEWAESSEAALQRKETKAIVRAQIDRLPEGHRTVLLLRDIEELSTEETARALGVTENAVKVRLHRARLALRTLLVPHFGGVA